MLRGRQATIVIALMNPVASAFILFTTLLCTPTLAQSNRPGPAGIPKLIEQLSDPCVFVRSRAEKQLVFAREAGVEPLIIALRSRPRSSTTIVHILNQIGDRRAVPAMIELLRSPQADIGLRDEAINALRIIKDPTAAGKVAELLSSPDKGVRVAAARTLALIPENGQTAGLLPLLKEDDQVVRACAVQALGAAQDPSAIEAIMPLLQDPSISLRAQAAVALAQMKATKAVSGILPLLQEPEKSARRQAVIALGLLADRAAVDPLIASLKDPDKEVKREAALSLGKIGDARAIPALVEAAKSDVTISSVFPAAMAGFGQAAVEPLIEMLKQTDDPGMVAMAMDAVGHIKDPRAVEPILAVADDPEKPRIVPLVPKSAVPADQRAWGGRVSASIAAKALSEIGDPRGLDYVLKFAKWDAPHRYASPSTLYDLTRFGQPGLKTMLQLAEDDRGLSSTVWRDLGRGGPGIEELLLDALKTCSPETRTDILEALRKIGTEKSVAPLVEMLGTKDAPRSTVCDILSKIGDRSAIAPLLDLARTTDDPSVAVAAARAAGHLGPESVIPLLDMLKSSEVIRKRAAIDALGGSRDKRAVKPLIALLSDPDYANYAAIELGILGDPEAAQPLADYARTAKHNTRIAATRALQGMGGAGVAPLCELLREQDGEVRQAAAAALGRLRDESAVEPLAVLLRDDFTPAQNAAFTALGDIGGPKAAKALLARLQDGNPDLRSKAALALGQTGDAGQALQPLIASLKDSDPAVRESAVEGLGSLNDCRIIDPLISALADTAPSVADQAVRSLERFTEARNGRDQKRWQKWWDEKKLAGK